MAACRKSKCSSGWPPLLSLHALLIFRHTHSHKHTVMIVYKQMVREHVKGLNIIRLLYASCKKTFYSQ